MVSDDAKIRLVKVFADSVWDAVCRVCRGHVVWAKTVTHNKWVLFDGSVRAVKERVDDRDGALHYYPTAAIHWNHCHDRRAGEQQRDSEAGGRARA